MLSIQVTEQMIQVSPSQIIVTELLKNNTLGEGTNGITFKN